MVNISAAEVNKLRQMTGAGMMDCKKALQETDGDFEKAIDYLRKKGQKVAEKELTEMPMKGLFLQRPRMTILMGQLSWLILRLILWGRLKNSSNLAKI